MIWGETWSVNGVGLSARDVAGAPLEASVGMVGPRVGSGDILIYAQVRELLFSTVRAYTPA